MTAPAANPPGQPAIAYRAGDYGSFYSSMLARLSSARYPALARLTVRDASDPAIALIDGWAIIADILTFYTERLANEGYLRTATDPGSLRLLGALAGYQPRPGVAASTYLAFTAEAGPGGADAPVTIPCGTRAQSVPAGGQESQAFESAEDLLARASWNDLAVRTRQPAQLSYANLPGRRQVTLAGVATGVSTGSRLLFVFGTEPGTQRLWVVSQVTTDQAAGVTLIGQAAPALPSLDQVAAGLAALLTDPSAGVAAMAARSRIVDRYAEGWLAPLATRARRLAEAGGGPGAHAELAARFDQALAALDEAAGLAARYPAIYEWLTATLRPALAALRALLEAHPRAAQPPGATAAPPLFHVMGLAEAGGGPGPVSDPGLLTLAAVLPGLRKPPGSPPASAAALVSDPARLFAAGSAAAPQLMRALDPRLRGTLQAALGKADITEPPGLLAVQAMRVTASPFGATAPLEPSYDAHGRIAGYVEWPLAGIDVLDVQVYFDRDWDTREAATVTFSSGGGSWSADVDLTTHDDEYDVDLGPGRVHITTAGPVRRALGHLAPGAVPARATTFTFSGDIPAATVTVSAQQRDGTIAVTAGDGTSPPAGFSLPPGGTATGHLGPVRVTSSRPVPAGGAAPAVRVSLRAPVGPAAKNVLTLDSVTDGIAPGSWVVIERPRKGAPGPDGIPGDPGLALVFSRVASARTTSRVGFGITGKVTELVLEQPWLDEADTLLSHIRDATVYARGEQLRLAPEAVTSDVAGDRVELARAYDDLSPGRWVVITGERADIPGTSGVPGTELSMIAAVRHEVDPARPGDTVHSTLILAAPLGYSYRRPTVHLYANVVPATQGATRDEVLGSGDASRAGQSFTLFQAPLTWVPAAGALGAASTLRVTVDGVPWEQVDTLTGHGPGERVYVAAAGDDGRVRVTFGDGVHGARLPTGSENVRARYRVGAGASGNLAAGQVSQLIARPLGVSGVRNPLPAAGGTDPDGPDEARLRIPAAATAPDRLVSVPDYEDFARARAGIAKASARRLFDGTREQVHVTIAGPGDEPLAGDSHLVAALRASLAQLGDPQLPVAVAVREAVLLLLAARVRVAPGHSFGFVAPRVRAALLAAFSPAARELGQPAYLSEALAVIQAAPGVDYADITAFTGIPDTITPAGLQGLAAGLAPPRQAVPARLARYEETRHVVPPGGDQTLSQVAAASGITVSALLALNPWITGAVLAPGTTVIVFRGIRPAQLVTLAAAAPDTLTLTEITS